jgi:hypothetical protein
MPPKKNSILNALENLNQSKPVQTKSLPSNSLFIAAIQTQQQDAQMKGALGRLRWVEHLLATNDPLLKLITTPTDDQDEDDPDLVYLQERRSLLEKRLTVVHRDHDKYLPAVAEFLSLSSRIIRRAYSAPQKSRLWLLIRWALLTGSNFGTAVGRCKYDPHAEKLLVQMLWGGMKVEAPLVYGNLCEPLCCAMYFLQLNGLLKRRLLRADEDLCQHKTQSGQDSTGKMTKDGQHKVCSRRILLFSISMEEFEVLEQPLLDEQCRRPFVEQMTSTGIIPQWFHKLLMDNVPSRYLSRDSSYAYPNRIHHRGLIISERQPFLATSPDGDVELGNVRLSQLYVDADGKECYDESEGADVPQRLLEIKCPSGMMPYPGIPEYYRCQIQGAMGLREIAHCDFAVYAPKTREIVVARYGFCQQYYETLVQELREFYFQQFIPALIGRFQGTIAQGECYASMEFTRDDLVDEGEQWALGHEEDNESEDLEDNLDE